MSDYVAAQGLYRGGSGNGVVSVNVTLNLTIADSLYNGASGDGIHQTLQNLNLTITDSLHNGGNGNGFSQTTQTGLNLLIADSLYNGGNGDGFYQVVQTGLDLKIIDSLYNGGNGKGDLNVYQSSLDLSAPCSGLVVYWNGSVSTTWGTANNWDCGVVPGVNTIVVIPSGKPRYPSLSTTRQIKQLILQSGATLILSSGGFLNITGF